MLTVAKVKQLVSPVQTTQKKNQFFFFKVRQFAFR